MSTSVLNTDANLAGKTIVTAEGADTVTGLKTFDRDPSAPFAVSSGSTVVANLDADKVDGADYETGTFTPIITGSTSASGQTYTTQDGRYVKIGKLYVATGKVVLSAVGTITGTVAIGGLPGGGSVIDGCGAAIGYWGPMTTNMIAIFGRCAGTSIFLSYRATAGSVPVDMVQADLAATTEFRFTVSYIIP